eukprot:5514216-Prymnesium_polylepis.1
MFTIQKLATIEPYDEKVQPTGLAQTTTLYPFQRQALAWMHSREEQEPHGGLLADEMGVGKTLEVIALILDNPRTVLGGPCIGATLIVTPSTIQPQWRSELALHSPGLKVCVFNGSDKSDESVARLSGYDVVLVSYDVLKKEVHRAAAHKAASSGCRSSLRFAHLPLRPAAKCIIMEIDWWRIVLDEVQYAKAGRNAGKMVRMLHAVNRWAVSGTPMRNGHPGDLLQLLNFIGGSDWLDANWAARFAALDSPTSSPQEKEAVVEQLKTLLLRRTKAAVDFQLGIPAQRINYKYLSPTPAELAWREGFILPHAVEHASSVGDEVLGTHLQLSLLSPDLWKKWLEDSTKAGGRLAEAAGNGSTAIRKLGGVFSTHKTGGGGFSDDLLKSLQKYADIDFKAKLSALRTEVEHGLLGLISNDEGLGLADSGEEREQQRKRDKDRRVRDGGLAADDLGYLQLLVG